MKGQTYSIKHQAHTLGPLAELRPYGRDFLLHLERNSIDGPIVKSGRSVAPLDARWIDRSHIPQVTSVLAAAWGTPMKSLQLLLHLSGDQVTLVPELHCP